MRRFIIDLRAIFSFGFKSFRKKSNLSQEDMAALLRISPRSYIDLEHAKYLCSTRVLVLYLLLLTPDDTAALMEQLKNAAARIDADAA